MSENDFLPENYEAPKSENNYLKFATGDTELRILASPVMGWEGWSNEDKPLRFAKHPTDEQIALLRSPKYGTKKIKHFWALIVYSYSDKKIMICQITQATIIADLTALARNEKWGSPVNYDLTVHKEGEKTDTKYSVIPTPPSIFSAMTAEELTVELSNIDLNELFVTGGDPFKSN